jgi:hypothetical protein
MNASAERPIPARWYFFAWAVWGTLLFGAAIHADDWTAVGMYGLLIALNLTIRSDGASWILWCDLATGVITAINGIIMIVRGDLHFGGVAFVASVAITVVVLIQLFGLPKPPPKQVRKVTWAAVDDS